MGTLKGKLIEASILPLSRPLPQNGRSYTHFIIKGCSICCKIAFSLRTWSTWNKTHIYIASCFRLFRSFLIVLNFWPRENAVKLRYSQNSVYIECLGNFQAVSMKNDGKFFNVFSLFVSPSQKFICITHAKHTVNQISFDGTACIAQSFSRFSLLYFSIRQTGTFGVRQVIPSY